MKRQPDPQQHADLVHYLLDELNDEKRDDLEERLVADAGFQEELAVAEQEIADHYVNKVLRPEQRDVVERKFAGSPEWKNKFDLARAMIRIEAELDATDAGRPGNWFGWFWRWRFRIPAVALAFGFAIAILWFAIDPTHSSNVGGSQRSIARVIASFVLAPAARKDGSQQADNVLALPTRPGLLEFRLLLDRDFYPTYQVQLQSLTTGQSISLGVVAPTDMGTAKRELRVSVDSGGLRPGRYAITLRASETDGSLTEVAGYSFRVTGN